MPYYWKNRNALPCLRYPRHMARWGSHAICRTERNPAPGLGRADRACRGREEGPSNCSLRNSLPSLALTITSKSKDSAPSAGHGTESTGRHGQTPRQHSCFPAPRQRRRTGTGEEQALPACTSTGTDAGSKRDRNHGHIPPSGALWGLAALLVSRTCLHNTGQNKLGTNWCTGWSPGSRRAVTTASCLSEQTQTWPSATGAAPPPDNKAAGRGSPGAALLSTCSLGPRWSEAHMTPSNNFTSVLPCPRSKGTGPPPGIPTCGCSPPEGETDRSDPSLAVPAQPTNSFGPKYLPPPRSWGSIRKLIFLLLVPHGDKPTF